MWVEVIVVVVGIEVLVVGVVDEGGGDIGCYFFVVVVG